jgi:hypothetical protein
VHCPSHCLHGFSSTKPPDGNISRVLASSRGRPVDTAAGRSSLERSCGIAAGHAGDTTRRCGPQHHHRIPRPRSNICQVSRLCRARLGVQAERPVKFPADPVPHRSCGGRHFQRPRDGSPPFEGCSAACGKFPMASVDRPRRLPGAGAVISYSAVQNRWAWWSMPTATTASGACLPLPAAPLRIPTCAGSLSSHCRITLGRIDGRSLASRMNQDYLAERQAWSRRRCGGAVS